MYGGTNLGFGLSLRSYGAAVSQTDPFFSDVTVLYGFEDASFSSGVHNDGSLATGTVTDNGVAPNTEHFVAGARSGAFNQNGALSNDGILLDTTADVIASGDFTVERFLRDAGTETWILFMRHHGQLNGTAQCQLRRHAEYSPRIQQRDGALFRH